MSTTQQITEVPTGTWSSDPTHSTFDFSVKHMVVATLPGLAAGVRRHPDGFGGRLAAPPGYRQAGQRHHPGREPDRPPRVAGLLRRPAVPRGALRVDGVHPRRRDVTVRGRLTLKGVTGDVELTGTLVGPVRGPRRRRGDRLELEGSIDRTEYGLNWNAPCRAAASRSATTCACTPSSSCAGPSACASSGSPGAFARDSHNAALLRAASREMPDGVSFELLDGLREVPAYDEDADTDAPPPEVVASAGGHLPRRRPAHRHAGVQQLHPRHPEERPRLGLPAPASRARSGSSRSRSWARPPGPSGRSGRRPSSARCWAPRAPGWWTERWPWLTPRTASPRTAASATRACATS